MTNMVIVDRRLGEVLSAKPLRSIYIKAHYNGLIVATPKEILVLNS